MRWLAILLSILLPAIDLVWNLTHLNIGLVDFYGVTLPALGLVQNGLWPTTPYFPAGYPLLLIPCGLAGSTLVGGYIFSAVGAVLALAGVRRLALELGAEDGWTMAAIALAWAEPTFRVTAGSPMPDMLMTGAGVWFLWSAVALWKLRKETQEENPTAEMPAPITQDRRAGHYLLVFLASATFAMLLRYHAYVLVLPVAGVALLAGLCGDLFGKRPRPYDPHPARHALWLVCLIFPALLTYLPYYFQHHSLGSTAGPLQVRIGLEADQPTFYKSTDDLFAHYSIYADNVRRRSVIRDYGVPVIARHTLVQLSRFLRRPPVVLAMVVWMGLVMLRRVPTGATPLALWMLLYSLALGVAYYTPRVALLVVLAGVALVFALLPRLCPRRTDFALTAACMLLLLAYWPAGKFARLDFAQRRHFAAASARAAQLIKGKHLDVGSYITSDMRVIRLPALDNPWQKPFGTLRETWLNDPAIYNKQLPGYRDFGDESASP